MSVDIIELSEGELHVGVLPRLGGAIAWLRLGCFDLLRPWDGTPAVRRTACFPLVPYSNRIANGSFSAHGARYQLSRNFGEHSHPIHGLGWQREWQLVEHSPKSCRLRLTHLPETDTDTHWPFAFEVEQYIRIEDGSVSLSMKLRNESQHAMPAGLGWHPYFPRHKGIELCFSADSVWINDNNSLPLERMQVPDQWNFARRDAVGYVGLDNCFEGWSRRAEFYWPQSDLSLVMTASEALDYLVAFTPPQPEDFIAVEPVSHLNNAINSTSPNCHGIVWLAPGQVMERWIQMRVVSKSYTENA